MATDWVNRELAGLHETGLHRRLRTFQGPPAPRIQLDDREVLLMCSNGYLGLAAHPRVIQAAQQAAADWGTSSAASRLISGNTPLHRNLEKELARLKGTEDAVLFATGYQANLGTIPALVGPGDIVLSDQLNHASLIDGCRLARTRTHPYPHNDTTTAAALLAEHRTRARRALILTDGVFSMDGDQAPLATLADHAQNHDTMLMVDDAHGTGVLGPGGAGTATHQGVADRIDLHMGTLSKALGAEGGFIAGSTPLCDYLRNRSRAFVYSTAPAPPTVAAAHAALQVLQSEPHRIHDLHDRANQMRRGLQDAGLAVPDGETPIIPIHAGKAHDAMAWMQALEKRGVFVAAIRPPTVPPDTSRLRVTVMATHTRADIEEAITAIQDTAPRPPNTPPEATP